MSICRSSDIMQLVFSSKIKPITWKVKIGLKSWPKNVHYRCVESVSVQRGSERTREPPKWVGEDSCEIPLKIKTYLYHRVTKRK